MAPIFPLAELSFEGDYLLDFQTVVKSRRSIRGYKTDPVPKALIDEVIEVAKGAPSSMNTQPWYVHVVTGEPLDRIRAGNTEKMMGGAKPHRDIPTREAYEESAWIG
jgi:predicted oxidoreductase (fatty acid repression mutant protein)